MPIMEAADWVMDMAGVGVGLEAEWNMACDAGRGMLRSRPSFAGIVRRSEGSFKRERRRISQDNLRG